MIWKSNNQLNGLIWIKPRISQNHSIIIYCISIMWQGTSHSTLGVSQCKLCPLLVLFQDLAPSLYSSWAHCFTCSPLEQSSISFSSNEFRFLSFPYSHLIMLLLILLKQQTLVHSPRLSGFSWFHFLSHSGLCPWFSSHISLSPHQCQSVCLCLFCIQWSIPLLHSLFIVIQSSLCSLILEK